MRGREGGELHELVERVEKILPEPWEKPTGRRKNLSLREAGVVAIPYLRRNTLHEELGGGGGNEPPKVWDKISRLTPLVEDAPDEFVPTKEEAVETVEGRVCLVDGTLCPCWSYHDHNELWTRKQGTTGHNVQVVTGL